MCLCTICTHIYKNKTNNVLCVSERSRHTRRMILTRMTIGWPYSSDAVIRSAFVGLQMHLAAGFRIASAAAAADRRAAAHYSLPVVRVPIWQRYRMSRHRHDTDYPSNCPKIDSATECNAPCTSVLLNQQTIEHAQLTFVGDMRPDSVSESLLRRPP